MHVEVFGWVVNPNGSLSPVVTVEVLWVSLRALLTLARRDMGNADRLLHFVHVAARQALP